MQIFTHYFLHFGFPFFVHLSSLKEWKKAYLILIATMLIDLDHLLVEPIFETNRCSINFHLYIRIRYVDLSSFTFLSKAF
jgi:hypothetical protein